MCNVMIAQVLSLAKALKLAGVLPVRDRYLVVAMGDFSILEA